MTHPPWFGINERVTPDHLGFIPSFLDVDDPDDAQTQFNKNYAHGGGFRPFEGFTLSPDRMELTYPDDPPYKALAATQLRDETIVLYEFGWVLVLKPDGTYVVARMD